MSTMWFANGLAAVLLATEVLSAQPTPISAQEAERARQLLNSSQVVDKAWGSYIAGRLHRDDLQQPLIEQFQVAGAFSGAARLSEEYSFVAALFDAAIESGITVPAAMLEPFAAKWVDSVLILLARSRDSDDLLLALREKPRDIVWLTANNLLCNKRSQRWYRAILAEVPITHRFIVSDSDSGGNSGHGEGGAICGDDFSVSMAAGFPPVTLYKLTNYAREQDVLLAEGPENVYYEREVVPTDKRVGFGLCTGPVDRMRIRIGYLANLRKESQEMTERLFHSETKIKYTTIQDFEATVERSIEAQEQGIRAFLQHIEKFSYLGPPVPDIRLQILPEVIDKRQDTTGLLPVVAPRYVDLH